MDASITIKMTPAEFDLVRSAIETAIEHEHEIQENIKDENTDPKTGIARVAANKGWQASQGREASLALLLGRLQ